MDHTATFRFYEELNDFLPLERRKREFPHEFNGKPSVKDTIESIGVPHTEVDLILVDGASVDFSYHLHGGERVSVYPVFESLDIAPVTRLRPKPLRRPAFILDVHLGRLASYLRILGFDTLYRNDFDDYQIIRLARIEHRIILTRDLGILKNSAVTHGYWLRSQNPLEQIGEVVERLDLRAAAAPLTRCPVCNGDLEPVSKASIISLLPEKTRDLYDEYSRCVRCGKIYWKGSHYTKLLKLVQSHVAQ